MAVIYTDHFAGGAGVSTSPGNSARAGLAQVLREMVTDLHTVAGAESTVVAGAAVVTALADGSDLATTQALANDLKAKYNAAVPLINQLRTAAQADGGNALLSQNA